jgi:predicted protein tyrosine phosphatase
MGFTIANLWSVIFGIHVAVATLCPWSVVWLLAVYVAANAALVLASMAIAPDHGGLVLPANKQWENGTRSVAGRVALAPWRYVSRAIAADRFAGLVFGNCAPPSAWSQIPNTYICVGAMRAAQSMAHHVDLILDLTAEWEWECNNNTATAITRCLPLLDDCMCSAWELAAALRRALIDAAVANPSASTTSSTPPRVYVGCMFGVGRSAAVGALLAAMLFPNNYPTVDAALAALQTVRPQVRPTAHQLQVARQAQALLFVQ